MKLDIKDYETILVALEVRSEDEELTKQQRTDALDAIGAVEAIGTY